MTLTYDLFAGAGGASLGLKNAGHEVHGFELWPLACETHRLNVGPCLEADLNDVPWDMFKRPDFLWASPPCQPFSAAGRGLADMDPRDGTPAFLRAVRSLLPNVVVMENVKGLTFVKNRSYLELILAALEDEGYVVEKRVLNCADYGVPQTRQRLFVIANRTECPTWPLPTHAKNPTGDLKPWVTMAEALGWGMTERPGMTVPHGSPQGGPDGFGGSGARATATRERDAGRWVHERPATTVACDPRVSFPGHHDEQKRGMSREHGAMRLTVEEAATLQGFPSKTIGTTFGAVAGKQKGGHVNLTVDEAATAQAFPEGFKFLGNKTQQFRQIGNAVPPIMAELIARVNKP